MEKSVYSHAHLLLVWGFYDDASLRRLHWNTEYIFGVGEVADSPLKTGLCVSTHEHRLWKWKKSNFEEFSLKMYKNELKQKKSAHERNCSSNSNIRILLDYRRKPTLEQFSLITSASEEVTEPAGGSPISTCHWPWAPSVLLWRHFRTEKHQIFHDT